MSLLLIYGCLLLIKVDMQDDKGIAHEAHMALF